MPSRPIQVIPPGLLGFLQLKNSGQNPVELPEVLQPVLETFEWYMQARASDFVNDVGQPSRACTVIGTFGFTTNPIVVPEREIWYVDQYSTRTTTLAAGEAIAVTPCYLRPLVGTQSLYKLGITTVAFPGEFCTSFAARPFWAPPGSELGFAVESIATAGSISVIGSLRLVRCPL